MSAPLVPSPLDYIGRRPFALYPAIRYAAVPNCWILGAGCWSEIQLINTKTGQELWIPRQYIGAVSDQQEALTVGLTQTLELRRGDVVPRGQGRIIQMPVAQNAGWDEPRNRQRSGPASVVAIRLEKTSATTFQKTPFRVGVCILFVLGLLALVASSSR
jgi:hypothetical protein